MPDSPATIPTNPADFAYDVEALRQDFPILDVRIGAKPLIYFDNAATTHKPQVVIDAIQRFYLLQNANIHRGVHYLSQQATDRYEAARGRIARFFNAASADEIVFVRGATEAINLVANTWGATNLREGDEILVTGMEHHANIVPWQLVARRTGAKLRVAPVTDDGEVDLDAYRALLGERTKLVAFVHVSNALGTVNPVDEMIGAAKAVGATVLLDGAQSAPHLPVDLQRLGCDFFVCSGHKIYGPTGIGILYGRMSVLESMPPWEGGGDMIQKVTFEETTFKAPPSRFEAGTPHISGAIALATAVDYLDRIGRERIAAHEEKIATYAVARLSTVDGLRIVGMPSKRAGAVSFTMDGVHPHDIGTILDSEGVAIRAGHHCTQPLMRRLGLSATARASFGLYNTTTEVDALVHALGHVRRLFS
ncbi:cysteine desulfurase [Opitutales bacterium ASA1]|uniref:SufS family cysteine desulfurase n=1 Tax=Congregicoccus parvus TaxID=3081749 RepID=UPI002B2DF571|nr:cysteine desulfurase [Opitutales bacterium ASA1]